MKRRLTGLLLLPFCYGISFGVWELLRLFKNVPEGSFYFIGGIFSYFAFQWVFFRPMRTYVFGHEMTHAMAAWMSGGTVKHFHVSKRGGSVTVTKTNFFVALAPYIVPLYAFVLVAIYYGAIWFYPKIGYYWLTFLWMLGAAFGFHMSLTSYALYQDQPDLKTVGKFLSATIIYIGNALSIVFLLGVLFPRTVSWRNFATVTGRETLTAFQNIGRGSMVAFSHAQETLHEHR